MKRCCSRAAVHCPGAQQGAEPALSHGTSPTRNQAALLCQQAGPFSHQRAEPSRSAGKQEALGGFASASVLRIGACECILMHLPYLAAKRKSKSSCYLCTHIQVSKKVPVRSSQVCFIPAI